MSDVARRVPQAVSLRDNMDYARALAMSNMLPAQYRGQPENVLWAIEFGRTIGLTPMAAIMGVHVIGGKPSASAGLISGLVRMAGHKLRIKGDAQSATATIVRADDPDEPFVVTFTIGDARTAGLLTKEVWRQYTSAMLKARAITQCARDACEEILFGLHYTPEELGADAMDEAAISAVVDGEVVGTPYGDAMDEDATRIEVAHEEALYMDVAYRASRMVSSMANPAAIRAEWDQFPRPSVDIDVRPVLTDEQAAMVAVADGQPITLRDWVRTCGKHTEVEGMSVNDTLLAHKMADVA